jgi:Domain of unknown function (DUF4407)
MPNQETGQESLYDYDAFEQKKKVKTHDSHFLWWCAGAYQELLSKYPSEHTKYAGLGGVILATFALATFSAGYAIYSVFGNMAWTVVFAIVWGVIIFNFDRFLVSTMRKYGMTKRRQLQLAIPRIVLAFFIGVTIARPLELKIFEKEIEVKMEENRHHQLMLNDSLLQKEIANETAKAQTERTALTNRKIFLQDTLSRLQQAYIAEADGTGGSGQRGIENLTRLKMTAYTDAQRSTLPELNSLDARIAAQDSLINSLTSGARKKQADYEQGVSFKQGFLNRNKALSDLSAEEPSVFWATLCISLLIILIEVGPVLSKLIMPLGPYDVALAKHELTQMSESETEMRADKALVQDKLRDIVEQKRTVSKNMTDKVIGLQKKYIDEEFDNWEKNTWKKNTGPRLGDVVNDLRDSLGFDEKKIL